MYIAKAYVWLNDATKRKELEDKINSDRGYESKDYKILTNNKRVCVNKRAFQACDVPFPAYLGYIDCNAYTPNGTEEEAVRLFLILAEMREKVATNSFVQWKDSIYLPNLPTIPVILKGSITRIMTMIGCDEELYHRLSPLEVAEAFKEGRIEL